MDSKLTLHILGHASCNIETACAYQLCDRLKTFITKLPSDVVQSSWSPYVPTLSGWLPAPEHRHEQTPLAAVQ
eukprot:2256805-Pyramimonas_sp.AAC.1